MPDKKSAAYIHISNTKHLREMYMEVKAAKRLEHVGAVFNATTAP
jgi:hypothetical protein